MHSDGSSGFLRKFEDDGLEKRVVRDCFLAVLGVISISIKKICALCAKMFVRVQILLQMRFFIIDTLISHGSSEQKKDSITTLKQDYNIIKLNLTKYNMDSMNHRRSILRWDDAFWITKEFRRSQSKLKHLKGRHLKTW